MFTRNPLQPLILKNQHILVSNPHRCRHIGYTHIVLYIICVILCVLCNMCYALHGKLHANEIDHRGGALCGLARVTRLVHYTRI